MGLDETSEAIDEARKNPRSVVDLKTLVTGGLVAIISTVIALYSTDQVRATEMEQLSLQVDKLEQTVDKLDNTVQKRATVNQLDRAEESSVQQAKSYTDSQVSQIKPVLTRLTVVLERLDEDRKEARNDRRAIQAELQELKTRVEAK